MHPLAKAQGFQLATSGHDKHKGISQVQVTKMGICQSTSDRTSPRFAYMHDLNKSKKQGENLFPLCGIWY